MSTNWNGSWMQRRVRGSMNIASGLSWSREMSAGSGSINIGVQAQNQESRGSQEAAASHCVGGRHVGADPADIHARAPLLRRRCALVDGLSVPANAGPLGGGHGGLLSGLLLGPARTHRWVLLQ